MICALKMNKFKKTETGKIKSALIKAIDWSNQKRKMLIFFIIFALIYTALHEYAHYGTMLLLKEQGSINWNIISPRLQLENIGSVSSTHVFLITICPYLLSLLILLILNIFNKCGFKNRIFSVIAFFPALDITWNFIVSIFIYIFGGSADFSNLLIISKYASINTSIGMILSIGVILLLGFYLFRPFYRDILYLIKPDEDN